MKLRYTLSAHHLYITVTLTSGLPGILSLSWRFGDTRKSITFGTLSTKRPKELRLLRSELGASHQIIFTGVGRTITKYIPARYLNLSSEHD